MDINQNKGRFVMLAWCTRPAGTINKSLVRYNLLINEYIGVSE